MKNEYILIAYKSDSHFSPGCNCGGCKETSYEADFKIFHYDSRESLCQKLAKFKTRKYCERENGHVFIIFWNGECIGEFDRCNCYNDKRQPKKLNDKDWGDFEWDLEYEMKQIEDEIEPLIKAAEDKMKQAAEEEEDRLIKVAKDNIKAAEEEKAIQERKDLRNLAKKYPEELA